jgi:hypothetical protein
MRPTGYRIGAALVVLVACLAGGERARAAPKPEASAAPRAACGSSERALTGRTHAYAAVATRRLVARSSPDGRVLRTFGRFNANAYPTVFGVLAVVESAACRPEWYRVQLPARPNGSTGYVRAAAVRLVRVPTRIVVDLSDRRVELFRRGRLVLSTETAIGSRDTPTPTGRYYVNQVLLAPDPAGPFGPGAVGISAFSPVLTGWAQGGPIAIHGTNVPSSIGYAMSHGCLRVANAAVRRLLAETPAGTPVLIRE